MRGNGKVFISHAHSDNARCGPLLAALDEWGIDYWFDAESLQAGDNLSASIQEAITERDVFIRVCTPAAQRSYWVQLETGAFRGLQAQEHTAGQGNKRTFINLILEAGYLREPFDLASLYILTGQASPRRPGLRSWREAWACVASLRGARWLQPRRAPVSHQFPQHNLLKIDAPQDIRSERGASPSPAAEAAEHTPMRVTAEKSRARQVAKGAALVARFVSHATRRAQRPMLAVLAALLVLASLGVLNFGINYPSDWIIQPDNSTRISSVYLSTTDNIEAVDLLEYVYEAWRYSNVNEDLVHQVPQNGSPPTLIDGSSRTQALAGETWNRREYLAPENGYNMHFVVLGCYHRDHVFFIVLEAPEESFTYFESTYFESMLQTYYFRW